MTADGTFIRAFAEAYEARIFTLDGAKGSYPGFERADRTNTRAGGGGGEWYGYAVRWILAFDVAADGSATADVCEASSITQDKSPREDILRHRLTYRRLGESPPVDQKGTARAPADSVFGEWEATEYSSQVPITKESIEPCLRSIPSIDRKHVDNSPGWPAKAN
ncbi:hypothetical protein [Mycolicibacterium sp.]|uniref:hypothetical protein n=1 Tax=Mycolicibacterium sp. TaxID=2320850 RepID=UPI001A1E5557|nr:hypothetical protein [Mycolicibacterium sp.]MBJ7340755.1 hypothetical protein [Mycolicibacterium sp.]